MQTKVRVSCSQHNTAAMYDLWIEEQHKSSRVLVATVGATKHQSQSGKS